MHFGTKVFEVREQITRFLCRIGRFAKASRGMRRKWGSCSSAGTVTLALDLAEEKPGFQDFVIVHELLHLRVPKHGRVFRALMSAYVPGWRKHDETRRGSS